MRWQEEDEVAGSEEDEVEKKKSQVSNLMHRPENVLSLALAFLIHNKTIVPTLIQVLYLVLTVSIHNKQREHKQ
jgi:hypothetical protein